MYEDGGQQFGQNNRQNIANQHNPMGGMGGMGGMNEWEDKALTTTATVTSTDF